MCAADGDLSAAARAEGTCLAGLLCERPKARLALAAGWGEDLPQRDRGQYAHPRESSGFPTSFLLSFLPSRNSLRSLVGNPLFHVLRSSVILWLTRLSSAVLSLVTFRVQPRADRSHRPRKWTLGPVVRHTLVWTVAPHRPPELVLEGRCEDEVLQEAPPGAATDWPTEGPWGVGRRTRSGRAPWACCCWGWGQLLSSVLGAARRERGPLLSPCPVLVVAVNTQLCCARTGSSSQRGDDPPGRGPPLPGAHLPGVACWLAHAKDSLCLSPTAGPAGRPGFCRVLAPAPPSLQTAALPPGSLPDSRSVYGQLHVGVAGKLGVLRWRIVILALIL